jgi:hypothetical protein
VRCLEDVPLIRLQQSAATRNTSSNQQHSAIRKTSKTSNQQQQWQKWKQRKRHQQ